MRLFVPGLFLTLVLSVDARPAPMKTDPVDARNAPLREDTRPATVPLERSEAVSPTYVPTQDLEISNVRTTTPARTLGHSDWDLELRGGYASGALLEINATESTATFGVQSVWNAGPDRAWDFFAEGTANSLILAGAGRRAPLAVFGEASYWKVFASQTLESSAQFGAIADLERIKGGVGIGSTDLFAWERRLVAELRAGYGLAGIGVFLNLGWSIDL